MTMQPIRRELTRWAAAVLVGVAVSSAWRGAWQLVDGFLLPQWPLSSAAASLGLGSALYAAMAALQPALATLARARASHLRLIWGLDTLFSYFGLWVGVLVWRGAWALWDNAFDCGLHPADYGDSRLVKSACMSHGVGVAVLLGMGAVRSLAASPTVVAADSTPLFGAVIAVDLRSLALERWRHGPPQLLSQADWLAAVGLVGLVPSPASAPGGACVGAYGRKEQGPPAGSPGPLPGLVCAELLSDTVTAYTRA